MTVDSREDWPSLGCIYPLHTLMKRMWNGVEAKEIRAQSTQHLKAATGGRVSEAE